MTASTFIILAVVAVYFFIFWLMLVRVLNARLPKADSPGVSYRVPEVVNFILENPTKKHFIAYAYRRDVVDVIDRLFDLGYRPENFDLNFSSVQRSATGWSSVERNCCLSCTSGLSNPAVFHQLSSRLRSPDAAYLLFHG